MRPGASGSPGPHQLVAGHHERHARAGGAAQLRPADRGRHAQLRRAERVAGAEHHLAGAHVLARAADVAARLERRHPHALAVLLGALHGHDHVGALGHHRAGGDAHRGALLDHAREGVPGARFAHHRQLAGGPATSAKPSIAELSKGGTSPARPAPRRARGRALARDPRASRAERPDLRQHPPRAPRRSQSACSCRQSFQGRAFARGAVLCKFRPGSAVFGGRIVLPPRTFGKRTDRRPMTPIRGPLARVDRSREELAKAFLVRLIERASLDEIRDLPTDRIARELPELISDILRSVASNGTDPYKLEDEQIERAASLAGFRGGRDASVSEVARDVASLQARAREGAAGGARGERPRAVRRRRGAPRGRRGRDPGRRDRGACAQPLPRARVAGVHRRPHRPRQSPPPPARDRAPARPPQALRPSLRPAAHGRGRPQADQRLPRAPGRRPRPDAGGHVGAPLDPLGGHRQPHRRRRVLRARPRAGPRERPEAGRAPQRRGRRGGGHAGRAAGGPVDRSGVVPRARHGRRDADRRGGQGDVPRQGRGRRRGAGRAPAPRGPPRRGRRRQT